MSTSDDIKQLDNQPNLWAGRWWAITAAILWSTSGFFAKANVFPITEWSPIRLAFWRAAFASLILLPMVQRPRWNPKLIPMVLFFVVMNYTFMSALQQTTAANAIWLQYTAPAWVFAIGVLVFKERVQRGDWWMIGSSCLGVGFILVCEMNSAAKQDGHGVGGVLFGLAAGATFAGVVLSIRQLADEDSAWLVALNHVVTTLVLLPFVANEPLPWPTAWQGGMLAGFGMLQMGIPYVFFARSLRHISGHQASGITLLEPVLMPIWVLLAWGEQPAYWTLIGGGMILIGLVMQFALTKPGTK